MENIIIVGTGECYNYLFSEPLYLLHKLGLLRVLSTVDIVPQNPKRHDLFRGVEHRIRKRPQKIHEVINDLKSFNPIVILIHGSEYHVIDSIELLDAGYRTIVEKPYCIDPNSAPVMKQALINYPTRISLAEYYLAMKSTPLMALAGKIKQNSFYFAERFIFSLPENSILKNVYDKFLDIIGTPTSICVHIIEGIMDGIGKVDHRGPHLTDIRLGGGMIQDLAIHAFAPLFALEDLIGKIDITFSDGNIFVARSIEYINMAEQKYGLDLENIGESYAEISFRTSFGIPVTIKVGKYFKNNIRHFTIQGKKGKAILDLNNCHLNLCPNQIDSPYSGGYIGCKKSYLPVIKNCLEELSGNSPFLLPVSVAAWKAQELILNILPKAHSIGSNIRYKSYIQSPDEIHRS